MRYAQIDVTGFCFAVSQLAGSVDAPLMIEIAPGVEPLGKFWDGESWQDSGAAPAELPTIVITNMTVANDPSDVARIAPDFTTLKMPVGATVTIEAELRYMGQVVEGFNQEFAMPLRSTDGFKRFINVQFVDGLTTFSATMSDSKRWEVDKALINSDLPEAMHMDFAGVVITAVE